MSLEKILTWKELLQICKKLKQYQVKEPFGSGIQAVIQGSPLESFWMTSRLHQPMESWHRRLSDFLFSSSGSRNAVLMKLGRKTSHSNDVIARRNFETERIISLPEHTANVSECRVRLKNYLSKISAKRLNMFYLLQTSFSYYAYPNVGEQRVLSNAVYTVTS